MIDFINDTDADSTGIKLTKLRSTHRNLPIITASVLATVIIAIIFTVTLLSHSTLDEDFFVSDDTKTTISLTPDDSKSNSSPLVGTRLVYTYDGDNVSGLKTYFEYPDEETAKTTFESVKDQPEFQGAVTEGKYIVVTADESQYKGLTAFDVKQQADALKSFEESKHPQDDPETKSEDNQNED